MKQTLRIISILCILSVVFASTSFAAIPNPDVDAAALPGLDNPSNNVTFIVMPSSAADLSSGISMYETNTDGTYHYASKIAVYRRVYTRDGYTVSDVYPSSGNKYVPIRLSNDSTSLTDEFYIWSGNLLPVSEVRTLSCGDGAINYYKTASKSSGFYGYLTNGAIVHFLGRETGTDGNTYLKVTIYDTKVYSDGKNRFGITVYFADNYFVYTSTTNS